MTNKKVCLPKWCVSPVWNESIQLCGFSLFLFQEYWLQSVLPLLLMRQVMFICVCGAHACVRVCVHACVHVGACISRNDNYFFILWFCFYLWCLLYLYKLICFYWWSWHQPCIELALYEIMGSGIGDSWNHPQRPEMCSFESFSAVPTRCAHSVVVSHSHYHEELLCLSCNLTYV